MNGPKNPQYFYESTSFPFLNPLIQSIDLITNELESLRRMQAPLGWLETFPTYVHGEHPNAWEVFTFKFFGLNHTKNQALCPLTTQLIRSIPELISCDFSRMKPHTTIQAHHGYSRMILRGHLSLILPEGNQCGIRVGDEIKHHVQGDMMVFDDSYEHSAWNHSNEERIVLMFDIPNPLWGYTAEEISRYKIMHLEDPFLLKLASKTAWLKALETGNLPL
jgi:beta-hydroxylase